MHIADGRTRDVFRVNDVQGQGVKRSTGISLGSVSAGVGMQDGADEDITITVQRICPHPVFPKSAQSKPANTSRVPSSKLIEAGTPERKAWGMYEFAVGDPDGVLVRIGKRSD